LCFETGIIGNDKQIYTGVIRKKNNWHYKSITAAFHFRFKGAELQPSTGRDDVAVA
jgi:hypothetical protein